MSFKIICISLLFTAVFSSIPKQEKSCSEILKDAKCFAELLLIESLQETASGKYSILCIISVAIVYVTSFLFDYRVW